MNQPFEAGKEGKYWTNRTGQAARRFRTRAVRYDDGSAWRLQHGVLYGTYLELANDRKHEAISPIILDLYEDFKKELMELYA